MASAVQCDSAPCFSQSHVTGTKVCGPTKQRIPPEVISNSQVAYERGVGTQSSKRYPRCDHQLATLIPSWAWCMCEMRHEGDGHCRCSSSCLVRPQACKSQQMKMSRVCSEKHAFVKDPCNNITRNDQFTMNLFNWNRRSCIVVWGPWATTQKFA